MSTTVEEMETTAGGDIRGISPGLMEAHIYGGKSLVVDIREPDEVSQQGSITGTVHVPPGLLELRADPQSPSHLSAFDPVRPTILFCAVGTRSALAVQTLRQLGYEDVTHLEGGFQAWKEPRSRSANTR